MDDATRTQRQCYEAFRALHHAAVPLVMPNAWDGMSAVLLKRAGFTALGSSSAAIAWGLGRQDGTHAVSLDEALANARLLGRASDLPVNGDLEDGFGPGPEDCVATVESAIASGLAGLGIEDTTADPKAPIHGFDQAVRRMQAAARAANGRILLTGRTDNFLQGRPDLADTVRRLTAFAEAGADVLYAPGLPDLDAIRTIARAVAPKPLNVVVGPGTGPVPVAVLAEAGVRRISLGGALYRVAMARLAEAARGLAQGDMSVVKTGIAGREMAALLPPG